MLKFSLRLHGNVFIVIIYYNENNIHVACLCTVKNSPCSLIFRLEITQMNVQTSVHMLGDGHVFVKREEVREGSTTMY